MDKIELFKSLYNEFKQLFEPSVTLFIGLLTYFIAKQSAYSSISKLRLDKAYHPLFMHIEPFLYKPISYDTLSDFFEIFIKIEQSDSILLSPSLKYWVHYIMKEASPSTPNLVDQKLWFCICDYISKDYDKLCKCAHLPVRSIEYRVNNRQYSSMFGLIISMLILTAPEIILFTILLSFLFPELLIILYPLLFLLLVNAIFDGRH